MKIEVPIKALGLALLVLSMPASALEFIVNSQADVPDEFPGNGQCSPVGGVGSTCTLRAAIMEANQHPGPHVIFLPSGSYTLSNSGADEDAAVTGDLDIHRQITIANFTNDPPLIWGNFSDRVFDIHAGGSLTLINVQVAGGMANTATTRHGGAFRVAAGTTLHLQQTSVSANVANLGGAIYSDGSVLIEDSEFFNNVLTDQHTDPQFANGAAILNRGQLGINRSTFRNNGVIPGGNGMFLPGRYAVHSRQGFVADPWVQIQNSSFYENTNGVFSDGVITAVINATLVNNGQRGLRFLPDLDALGEVQFRVVRTVLYGHTGDCNGLPDDQVEFDVSGRINASSDESCGFTGSFDFQNISNPFLPEPGLWGGKTTSLMPRSDSILIDPPGSTCGFLASLEDQRGQPRPVDANGIGVARCDIGALEFQPGMDPVLGDSLFSDRFQND
jgi:CSLREA domain-containing protein